MRKGGGAQWQRIEHVPGYEEHLYHPSVIQRYSEWFNKAAQP